MGFVRDIFGKDTPAPPPAPDFRGMAVAQGAANLDAARASGKLANPSYDTPVGSRRVSFGYGGDPDQIFITDTLSPTGRAAFDQANRISSQLGGMAESGLSRVGAGMTTPFDMNQVRARAQAPVATEAGRQAVQDAIMARVQPMLDRQRTLTQNNLLVQGHNPGGAAWNAAQDDLMRAENDARLAAVRAGGEEQSRLFGLGQAGFGMQGQGRAQDIQEQAYLRSLPLSELNQLRTGLAPTMPQFQQYQGVPVQAAPIMQGGIAGAQYDLGTYGAQMGLQQAREKGLYDLASAGIGAWKASDRRLKSNIVRIGTLTPHGIGVYEYDIQGRHEIGVMADEVLKVRPSAVTHDPSGYMMVNYGAL